jgi:hypothetical protein
VNEENKKCTAEQSELELSEQFPRMLTCNPDTTFQYLQSLKEGRHMDEIMNVPALGECGDFRSTAEAFLKADSCFKVYKHGIPLALDKTLPYAMDEAKVPTSIDLLQYIHPPSH